jgi:hypothetical protein
MCDDLLSSARKILFDQEIPDLSVNPEMSPEEASIAALAFADDLIPISTEGKDN